MIRFNLSNSTFKCFTLWVPCCHVRYDFRIKNDVWFIFTSSCSTYLRYLCLFPYSSPQRILCCVFVWFVFILCTLFLWIVHLRLPLGVLHILYPISLDCPFKTTPRFSPYLWIVHLRLPLGVLHLVYPISLDCSFKTTPPCSPCCVPYFSELFI